MAVITQDMLYFMSVGVSPSTTPETSFEELRMQDYLKAYSTTHRRPAPCPQTPDTPAARAALGLPPLFVPVAIPNGDGNSTARPPSELPPIHLFESVNSMGERFQCISAQSLYSYFSHEELRHLAYAAGNKTAPPSVLVSSRNSPPPYYANDSRATAYMTATIDSGPPEYFMSITASPTKSYNKQSFEELRIAHLATSRQPPLGPQLSESLTGRPRGDAVSLSSNVPRMF